MRTISHIANWVRRTVGRRDDINRDIVEEAIGFYVEMCTAVPFPALYHQSDPIPTVAGQGRYDLAAAGLNIAGIRHIIMDFDGFTRKIERSHQRVYARRGVITSSRPATYARVDQNQIEFNPPPDSSSYTFTVFYWGYPEIPSLDANVSVLQAVEIVTPMEWDQLLKWETLSRIYLGVLQRPDLYAMINMTNPAPYFRGSDRQRRVTEIGIVPKLWNDLLRTVDGREFVDEDFGISPKGRMQAYTAGGARRR